MSYSDDEAWAIYRLEQDEMFRVIWKAIRRRIVPCPTLDDRDAAAEWLVARIARRRKKRRTLDAAVECPL